MKILCVRVVFL